MNQMGRGEWTATLMAVGVVVLLLILLMAKGGF